MNLRTFSYKLRDILLENNNQTLEVGIMVGGHFRPIKKIMTRAVLNGGRMAAVLETEQDGTTRVVEGRDGRWAVFARMKQEHEWVQVESIISEHLAKVYASTLDKNESDRAEAVEENIGQDWGLHKPVSPPK